MKDTSSFFPLWLVFSKTKVTCCGGVFTGILFDDIFPADLVLVNAGYHESGAAKSQRLKHTCYFITFSNIGIGNSPWYMQHNKPEKKHYA